MLLNSLPTTSPLQDRKLAQSSSRVRRLTIFVNLKQGFVAAGVQVLR